MTIKRSPYDTTSNKNLLISKTIEFLDATSEYEYTVRNGNVLVVTSDVDRFALIPSFTFPIIDVPSYAIRPGTNNTVFVDARPYGNVDKNTLSFKVRDTENYNNLILQAKLVSLWANYEQNKIKYQSDLPCKVFATLIGESIAKKMHLNGQNQYIVTVLAAVWYLNQFENVSDKEVEDNVKLMVGYIRSKLYYSANDINESIVRNYYKGANQSTLSTVDDFCKAAYEMTQSATLKNLNPTILYSIVGSAFWGARSIEKMSVAIEYPPVFIAILYQVIVDNSYRNKCVLSTIALRNTFKKELEPFVRFCLTVRDDAL